MENNTIILIAVRLKSNRLKKKALLELCNIPLILALTQRLQKSVNASNIVWCTSINPQDDELYSLAKKNDIPCVRGAENDVISRFIKAGDLFKAKNVIRVTGDNPLTDSKLIDLMIEDHITKKADYTFCEDLPIGSRSEVISIDALKFSHKNLQEPENSEYMTWMFNRKDIYKVNKYISKNKKVNFPNLNLSVDTHQEYNNIKKIFNFFNKIHFDLEYAIEFINNNIHIFNDQIYYKINNSKNNNINVKYRFEK